MRSLHDKLVVVTGAASGIGRATAKAFAADGARLVIADIDEVGLTSLADELGAACVLARHVDVADRAAMAALADAVHAIAPAADVIVNNAGVAFAGTLLTTPLPQWDWVLGINLGGVIHGCHFFVPAMVARGQGGHVVNVSSVLGMYGAPGTTAYVASKFAVLGLSQALRAELAEHHIGVSAICPGMIATQIVASARAPAEVSMKGAIDAFRKRGAPPERVATAIVAAVKSGRAVVPVTPTAWAIWGMSRLAPSVLERIGARAVRRLSAKRRG